MRPCTECPKYASCTELCELVKAFVNKDRVSRNEMLIGEMDMFDDEIDWPTIYIPSKKKDRTIIQQKQLRMLIIQLYLDGKTPTEISRYLPISQAYVSQVISKRNNQVSNFNGNNKL